MMLGFMVLLGIWVRSYFITDEFFIIYTSNRSNQLKISRGWLMLRHTVPEPDSSEKLERLSYRSTRTTSLLPSSWMRGWKLFHSTPASTPLAIRQAEIRLRMIEVQWIELDREARVHALNDAQSLALDGWRRQSLAARSSLQAAVPWWEIGIPARLPMGLLCICVLWRASRNILRDRRIRAVLCPTCSYDLRASKDRCPECGTPIQPAKMPA